MPNPVDRLTEISTDITLIMNFPTTAHYFGIPQIDVLEDPVICNVVIFQTVLQEVRHRSAPVYKRLKDLIHEEERHFYTFTNEHHRCAKCIATSLFWLLLWTGSLVSFYSYRETFIEREPGESANDRNDRAIRVAAKWYSEHLAKPDDPKLVLLTNDVANKQKAEESGLLVYKCKLFGSNLLDLPDCGDNRVLRRPLFPRQSRSTSRA